MLFEAAGVGNQPNSVPPMPGPNVGSWYAMPLRIIPDLGQVSENDAKPSIKQCCDVLQEDEFGSYVASKAYDFPIESASLSFQARTLPRDREVLAGKPATDDVGSNSICGQSFRRKGADILVDFDARVSGIENLSGIFADFAERDGFESARAMKAEGEHPKAAEQVQDLKFLGHAASSSITTFPPLYGRPQNRTGALNVLSSTFSA